MSSALMLLLTTNPEINSKNNRKNHKNNIKVLEKCNESILSTLYINF